MQVAGFHFLGLNDPVFAALSLAGVLGFGLFVGAAVLRLRGGRAWDRAFLVGGVLFAVAFVGTLLYTWLASPALR